MTQPPKIGLTTNPSVRASKLVAGSAVSFRFNARYGSLVTASAFASS
jgi:hypothetical protein